MLHGASALLRGIVVVAVACIAVVERWMEGCIAQKHCCYHDHQSVHSTRRLAYTSHSDLKKQKPAEMV